LFGVGDNVKPIAIGTVIVLAVVLGACRNRFLRAMEARRAAAHQSIASPLAFAAAATNLRVWE